MIRKIADPVSTSDPVFMLPSEARHAIFTHS